MLCTYGFYSNDVSMAGQLGELSALEFFVLRSANLKCFQINQTIAFADLDTELTPRVRGKEGTNQMHQPKRSPHTPPVHFINPYGEKRTVEMVGDSIRTGSTRCGVRWGGGDWV